MGRRVLVTGVSKFWGGKLAQALERDPSVDVIVGLDTVEPTVPLERTEFVRADQSYSILARLVRATQVDTILHTFLVVDSTGVSARELHEINVIGTMNLLAAAGASESPVRRLVVKSSGLVYGATAQDPYWFREDMSRTKPPATPVERSLAEVEAYLGDFADDNPHVAVTLLRFANVLGTSITTPITTALQLPVAPSVVGFDPLLQFVEENDVVRALEHVLSSGAIGIYNVAGDGRMPWSEVAAICGRRLAPLPPFFTSWATAPLRAARLVDIPPELVDLLRYGRGLDNRRLKSTGFSYRFSTAAAVKEFAESVRLRDTIGEREPTYTYERDVETFFRHSSAVVREPGGQP